MQKYLTIPLFILVVVSKGFGQAPYLLSDSYSGPGNGSALLFSPAKLNNIFIYTGNDTTNGAALWRTDGTQAGTFMLKDFNPSSNLPGTSTSAGGTVVNNRLIFSQYTSTEGNEKWTTDGTVAGTMILKDIIPGPTGSNSSYPSSVLYNNIFYFNARDTIGLGLWQSDGTPAGTHKVNSSVPLDSGVTNLFIVNNKLTFLKSVGWPPVPHLFSLDNTSGNPVVTDITPPVINLAAQTLGIREIYNGILYFGAGYHSSNDIALFRTDGTQSGTYFVHQFDTRTNSVLTFSDQLNSNQALIFASNDSSGTELFSLDLTTETCSLVKDIWPGSHPSLDGYGNTLVTSFNKMFFYANDGVHGSEPWISDGTSAGTFMLKDIDPTNSNSYFSSGPPFIEFNNRVLFNEITTALGEEWYTTDGTVAGTDTLINFGPLSQNGYIASGRMFIKNNLYYIIGCDYGAIPFKYDVFYTDGSPSGTHRLDICPDIQCNASPFYVGTDSINHYFWAADMTHGAELWKSDGNPSSTMMITDYSPGSSKSMPTFHGDNGMSFFFNNEMYFKMNGAYPGVDEELWKVNGVTNAFTQVSNFDSDTIAIGNFKILDGRYVIFPVQTDSLGIELWAMDFPGIVNSVSSPAELKTRIYPNPNTGIVTIEFSNDFDGYINLSDMLGRVVTHIKINGNKIQIDITNNPDGVYVIQFISKEKTWSEKIIIRH